ncbi:MAG: hypothetical protein ACON4U_07220 [Myxococcota bacterium]
MVILSLFLSCSTPDPSNELTSDAFLLQPSRRLARASLDIRGKLPTLEEQHQIIADPEQFEVLVDKFLQDPGFGPRVREIFGAIYTTERDRTAVNPEVLDIDPIAFQAAIGQEPLRIIQKVAEDDMPWSTVVTADWTMANEIQAALFPIDYPSNGSGWQQVKYTDGRPAAGILSTNGMWWVYGSTSANANRKRANTVSRLLLCTDYLQKPISFERDINLLDGDAVETAIQSDPACVGCHNTLDPLAAHFFGFWSPAQNSWLDLVSYHPDREPLYASILGVRPSYYGLESQSLSDLGRHIASDERFGMCTVKQMVEQLLQVESPITDIQRLKPHREAFIQSGQQLRSLIRSIILSPEYSVGRWETSLEDRNAHLLHVDQLASSVEALTGFRWTHQGRDVLRSGTYGLRVLAGGADGETVYEAATAPSPTMLLSQARLAELAAAYAVEMESQLIESERQLFTLVNLDAIEDPNRQIQFQQLHLQVLAQPISLDGPEVLALNTLFEAALLIEGNAQGAWVAVLTALLRDPNFLIY